MKLKEGKSVKTLIAWCLIMQHKSIFVIAFNGQTMDFEILFSDFKKSKTKRLTCRLI